MLAADKADTKKPAGKTDSKKPVEKIKKEFKEYGFMNDYIDCILLMKSSHEKYSEIKDAKNIKKELIYSIKFNKAARESNIDLNKVKETLTKYKEWDNKKFDNVVKSVVDNTLDIVGILIITNDNILKMFNKYADIDKQNGTFSKEACKLLADRPGLLKLLASCSEMAANIMLAEKKDQDGNLSSLVITKEERDKLAKKLEDAFGEKVKYSYIAEEETYFAFCGGNIYKILDRPWNKYAGDK